MPSLDVNVGAGDGYIRKYGGAWSGLVGTGSVTGNDAYPTATADYCCVCENTNPMNGRGFFPFSLSGLPAGATITGLVLKIYVTAKGSAGGGTSANNSVAVVKGTPSSTTTLATSDFGNVGSTEWASRTQFSAFTTSAYNSIALNSTAIADAQARFDAGQRFVPALRGGYDLDNVAPTGNSNIQTKYQENGSNAAILTVTYEVRRTGTDTLTFTDTGAITAVGGGAHYSPTASGADTLAFSGTTSKGTNPRTAGTERTIWTGGTVGTFGAHYAFPFVVRTSDNRLLAVCRKATSHASYDGSLVGKYSTDDGASWGSEFTIIDGTSTGYDERDPGLMKLASGRLCLVNGRRKFNAAGDYSGQPRFYYSDDNGATWSSGVSITTGLYGGTAGVNFGEVYASDVVQLHNGDLLCAGYGTHSSSVQHYDLFVSKSTDGGATWAALSNPATYSGDGGEAVEPQLDILGTGTLFLTYHVGTNAYYRTSTDNGATWSARTLLVSNILNRQGLSVMSDGQTILVSYYASPRTFYYLESRDYGATWLTAATIQALAQYGLWAMSASLAGIGNQQNVGFIYNSEDASQVQASVFYKQFSGMDGVFIYTRSGTDAIAFTDTATRIPSYNRTGSDQLAWTDTSTRAALSFTRSGADTLTWGDTASGVRVTARNGTDTLSLADSADSARIVLRTGADTLTLADSTTRTGLRIRIGTDTLTWGDSATRGSSATHTSGADLVTFTDAGAGIAASIPRAPYTVTGGTRARFTASGETQKHARLSGGPTP